MPFVFNNGEFTDMVVAMGDAILDLGIVSANTTAKCLLCPTLTMTASF